MPELSICIVSHNTRALLETCLSSLFRDENGSSFEIIVVDNDSRDQSARMVAEKFPEVRLIRNRANLYYTCAMNQALENARGDFVVLLNPDTEILPGSLTEMLCFLKARPAFGAVGCRLLDPDGTLQRTGTRFPSLSLLLLECLGLNRRYPHNPVQRWNVYADWDRTTEREVEALSGACLMLRREVLERVGLLDDNFRMYFEEVDWCHRLHAQGWRVGFDPQACVIHHSEQSARQLAREIRDEIYWASLLYYARKYYGTRAETALRAMLKLRARARQYLFTNGRRRVREPIDSPIR